jgi:hypothetical protein
VPVPAVACENDWMGINSRRDKVKSMSRVFKLSSVEIAANHGAQVGLIARVVRKSQCKDASLTEPHIRIVLARIGKEM